MSDWTDSTISDSTNNGWDSEIAALIDNEADKAAFLKAGEGLLDMTKSFLFDEYVDEDGNHDSQYRQFSEFEALCESMDGDLFPAYLVYMTASFLKGAAEIAVPLCKIMDETHQRGLARQKECLTDKSRLPSEAEIQESFMERMPAVGTDAYYDYMNEELIGLQKEVSLFRSVFVDTEDEPPEWLIGHMNGVMSKIDYIEMSLETTSEHGDE